MIWIIIPVFNTEDYIAQAIESVISQTVWETGNIGIHLVDDASVDGSLAICEEYAKKYENRIIVTHFEQNQGVAKARNYALDVHRNEKDVVIGFLDSDDRLGENSVEKVMDFFNNHEDIDVAVMELFFFDAVNKPHRTNWRFEKREVVDIRKDIEYPQYFIGGAFFRGRAVELLRFDEELTLWEDAIAIFDVLLSVNKYGLVSFASYFYRKRDDQSSLVDVGWTKKERYTPFLEKAYVKLMHISRKKKHRVIPWIKFAIAYHCRLYVVERYNKILCEVLTKSEQEEFIKEYRKILKKISPKILVRVQTSLTTIEAMLSIRENKKVRIPRFYENNDCLFKKGKYVVARVSERSVRIFGITEDEDNMLSVKGRFSTPLYAMKKNDYIFAVVDGKKYKANRNVCRKKVELFGEVVRNYKNAGFIVQVPKDTKEIQFGVAMEGHEILINKVNLHEIML